MWLLSLTLSATHCPQSLADLWRRVDCGGSGRDTTAEGRARHLQWLLGLGPIIPAEDRGRQSLATRCSLLPGLGYRCLTRCLAPR